MTDYDLLARQLSGLVRDVPYPIANLANAVALIYGSMERINWAGFYLLRDGRLILGPFQGKPACVSIPVGRGVCGTAAEKNETVLVPDVHAFPGHIACDCASRSEIVVPLRKNGEVAGVLDIDSPEENRFSGDDRAGLEALARVIETAL